MVTSLPSMPGSDPLQRRAFPTVVEMLWHAVDVAAGRPALRQEDRTLTYSEFGAAVSELAHRLIHIGVSGQRVAVLVPNSIEANVAIFAVLAAGAQVTLFNPAYTAAELRPLIRDSAPLAMLTLAGCDGQILTVAREFAIEHVIRLGAEGLDVAELARSGRQSPPTVQLGPESDATLIYTGGTTGVPKGVSGSHRRLVETVEAMDRCWPTRLDDEVWLNVAPVFHVWGFMMGCMNPVYGRSPLVIVPQFKPGLVVEALERERVSIFSGGPAAIYVALMAVPEFRNASFPHLKLCPGGGSTFLLETMSQWEAATGVPIVEAYGMTEAGPITANTAETGRRPGSVGRPIDGMEVEVVDLQDGERMLPSGEAGEIRVRGSRVVSRYRGDGRAAQEGPEWFYTGDVGYFDEDGFLYLVDRKKDMLIVGGFNVYPREIEEVLTAHPEVHEAAVVGRPCPRKGEVPVAFLTVRPGTSVETLADHCRTQLAAYKLPQDYLVLDAIPKTPANKTDKSELARWAGAL